MRVGAEQVGWANGALLAALAAQIKLGRTCALEAREVRGLPIVTLVGGLAHEGTMVEGVPTLGLQLAPDATSVAEATRLVAALVDGLVEDGFIPAAKIRQELQDVWPLARGFVGVVNRSQQDINEGKPPAAARDDFAAYAPTPPADRRPLPATTRLPLDMMAPPSKRTPTLSGGFGNVPPRRPPRE
mgnify:CR=1 FL=1